MLKVQNDIAPSMFDLSSEEDWMRCMNWLRACVRRIVYSAHLVLWRGQEEDIIEDVVQETVRRILERSQQAERLEAAPICSLERMCFSIAHNYCIDMLRRDSRLLRVSADCSWFEDECVPDNQANAFEVAIEQAFQEEIFTRLAHQVARFPEKRRRALLIDLANRMCFERELTPLQKAFMAVGIDFREFRQALPSDPANRSRHGALKSLAYKQISTLMQENAVER